MRINPVYTSVYAKRNLNTGRACKKDACCACAPSLNKDSISFGSLNALGGKDLKNIVTLIMENDESRLDGTIQGLYQYGRFMVKAPDNSVHDTAIKEFYALTRIGRIFPDESVAPLPTVVSKVGDRHFLVEEYVKGKHASKLPFSLEDVKESMGRFVKMDQGGLINQDLAQRNIIVTPEGVSKMIDFDSFSFLADDGRVLHSQSTMPAYFASRVSSAKLKDTDYSGIAGSKLKSAKPVSFEEMFANSFTVKRKIPTGIQDLIHARNLSDNPFIGVPSNLTSYEGRTIYKRIADNDVEDVVEFLRDYLQLKSQKYHPQMKEFLEKLQINPDLCGTDASRLTLPEAKARLKNAIEYEDLVINLFGKEKPDAYFAKLEAAKMQLNGLLFHENLNKGVSNKEQLHSAYEKLIKVITDGLEEYKSPEHQKFLRLELEQYREVFENTGFSVKKAKQEIVGPLDIVQTWFLDKGVDKKSFSSIRSAVKEEACMSAYQVLHSSKKKGLKGEALIAAQKEAAALRAREIILLEAGGRLSDSDVNKVVEEIAEEAMGAVKKGNGRKIVLKMLDRPANEVRAALKANALEEAESVVKRSSKKVLSDFQNPDELLANQIQRFQKNRYIKNGGKLFAGIGILLAAAAFVGFQYNAFKKQQEEQKADFKN